MRYLTTQRVQGGQKFVDESTGIHSTDMADSLVNWYYATEDDSMLWLPYMEQQGHEVFVHMICCKWSQKLCNHGLPYMESSFRVTVCGEINVW